MPSYLACLGCTVVTLSDFNDKSTSYARTIDKYLIIIITNRRVYRRHADEPEQATP